MPPSDLDSCRNRPPGAQGSPENQRTLNQRTLIFGCGYVGRRVARLAQARGDQVWATTRDRRKAEAIEEAGWRPLIADWNRSPTLRDLPPVDRLLVAVSHDSASRVGRYESQVLGLQRLLNAIAPTTRVVYISTTGVYHQRDGRWVDETSPTRPTRPGGQAHLMAEERVRRWAMHRRATTLRLGGIYGPGRVPRIADVRDGRVLASPGGGYLNLIHVADAAAAVMAAWQAMDTNDPESSRVHSHRLFAVADDRPVVRREFYQYIADRLAAPTPRFADGQSKMSVRSDSNKRVWNRRMKRCLLPRLAFPTYRQGLDDVLDRDRRGGSHRGANP
ncbi:NAD-dependent epimerase/dehydratase family protein [Crateriforma conspicua]|uniref:NAD dependent epimerase/dehydratase family protein n=1 Tax=Crateriforma conspicua TaxID=2527996 RepID=A0A5C6FL06_9PLAN|nr:NAD-dependent epimerase/dehydratase family protein [Crateriforma conspicua]TWU62697.1 NAD dependent epimerase/dehydratase family protein [Crateriforma conspicua]